MKSEGCQLSAADVEKIDISKFDETDPRQHIMKVLFGMGFYAAFRGSSEHALMKKSQISFGTYPDNFENSTLAGKNYVAIANIPGDKTRTVTVTNSYARDTSQVLRFPVNSESLKCFGGTLSRYYHKLAPGQIRFYCQVATAKYKQKLAMEGFPNAEFYGNKPLGRKSIATLFKEGAKLLGLPASFRPHSLRGACITKLANDSSVSIAETMAVARHTSVSASRAYQRVDGVSEGNRLNALGQLVLDPEPTSTSAVASVPAPVPPTGLAKPPEHPMRQSVAKRSLSQEESDSDDEFVAFRAKRRRRGSSSSESSVGDLSKPKSATVKAPDITPTQVDIAALKSEVADLEDSMKPKKPEADPVKSENRKVVAELREVVRNLQRKVDSRDHDILYYRSIENDQEEKIDRLKEDLEREQSKNYKLERELESLEAVLRDVQRENGELNRICFGSGGGRRSKKYY